MVEAIAWRNATPPTLRSIDVKPREHIFNHRGYHRRLERLARCTPATACPIMVNIDQAAPLPPLGPILCLSNGADLVRDHLTRQQKNAMQFVSKPGVTKERPTRPVGDQL